MTIEQINIEQLIHTYNREHSEGILFSGAVLVNKAGQTQFEQAYGYANRSEKLKNTIHTRFGIASGCKIFTAVAICQLVEQGLIEFNTPIYELNLGFNVLDKRVTVHHLLTHTSGIADYFDEEVMDDYEGLWKQIPMYTVTSSAHFLPLFEHSPMKFVPGTQFSYNNAGFIVLGLIVEKLTGCSFTDYVTENILNRSEMFDSGYFRMDQLPEHTAIGYVGTDDNWRTNIYSIPIVGGADGGAYTTVNDLAKFWNALFNYKLLSKPLTTLLLTPHVHESDGLYYGYGVWIIKYKAEIFKYFVMGGDPGVVMQSSYYPMLQADIHVISNTNRGAGMIANKIDELIASNK